jgi:ferredoxin
MVSIDRGRCQGCGECTAVCPHSALTVAGEPARAALTAPERCMECGACGLNCPADAISGNFGVACFVNLTGRALRGRDAGCGCGGG